MDNVYMFGQDVAEAIENDTVEISREQYDELLERDAWLSALEDAGVDNWEGYDFAREVYDLFNKVT